MKVNKIINATKQICQKVAVYAIYIILIPLGTIIILREHPLFDKSVFLHPRTEADIWVENHTLDDCNDPNFFQKFFFLGYPGCDNIADYFEWRDDHPECQ